MSKIIRNSVSIVLAGEAGQGIQSIESILTALLKLGRYHVFATKEYMSRVRGGDNTVEIVVSSRPRPAFVDRIDILIPLNKAVLEHVAPRMGPQTVVVGDAAELGLPGAVDVPFQKLAAEAGGVLTAGTVAAGLVAGLFGLDAAGGADFVGRRFARKGEALAEANRKAFAAGHAAGRALSDRLAVEIDPDPAVERSIMVTGNEAVALGAVAGGVQYAVAYPMSPGTAVIEHLAELSKRFDILVEQVEDEIGVVNMALGANFAGARSLVTTSGGGFALMAEGVSLAGMAEIPLVAHVGQRPGPATGLPTRTLQGDLFLAAFAGHGDFARLVLAPGDLQEAFVLSGAAFELAERFQVPAFLLTDQYLLESYHDTAAFDPAAVADYAGAAGDRALAASRAMEAAVAASPGRRGVRGATATRYDGPLAPAGFPDRPDEAGRWLVDSGAEYRRFALSADGVSPRALPGRGAGLAVVDSDEHDETGHITEDLRLRDDMVHKRAAKAALLAAAAPLPQWIGPADAAVAVVGWGSTKGAIAAALASLAEAGADCSKVAQVHFSWVHPLPAGLAEFLGRAKRLVLVENNEGGHLGKLLAMEAGVRIPDPILRYDGLPFSVEGLAAALAERLAG